MTDGWEPRPLPAVNPETEAYWEAAADGRLLLGDCADCGLVYHYPRRTCPECLSADVDWREAEGRGEVYSYSIVRTISEDDWPQDDVPFVVAYVELEEGPRVMTNVETADPESVAIGDRVEVRFRDTDADGVGVPVFVPVE